MLKTKDLCTVACYILNFVVPRCFGLFPSRYDSITKRFVPSRLWLTVCSIYGLFFVIIYPFAATALFQNRPPPHIHSIGRIIMISHLVIPYLLSVGALVRFVYFSMQQMDMMNRCMRFYRHCETLSDENMDVNGLVYPLIFRGIYSHFGYALLNFLLINYLFGDLSRVNWIYKIVYFIPYTMITTATIRFHSGVMQLTICGRRLNHEFHTCIDRINAAHIKSKAELDQMCKSALARFEYLTTTHGEWYEICRILEKELSLMMIFTIINSFINITQAVSRIEFYDSRD